ncbi:MAG: DHA2 family efflux MFS transporter permease subunit [Opitutaceae bacterium]|nr:DHA2 family efflux MFS transporter permease subunit [Opitutaceae bacterium]
MSTPPETSIVESGSIAPAFPPTAGNTRGKDAGVSHIKRVLPWLVATSFFMESLDMTILNTAVPTVAAALGVAPLSLKTALTSYTLSLALFIPLSGWMADRFGTRRVFFAAILVFTIGSLLCGLAVNIPMLIASRIVQGVGGAMMMPVGRIAIVRTFPKAEILQAMSFVVIPGLIGPLMGPLAGGAIVNWLHWRAIFFINIPIGLAGLWAVHLYMPDYRSRHPRPFDLRGFLLFGGGVALLSHALEVFGEHDTPSVGIAAMLALASALIALYLRHAFRHAHPMLPLALFRHRTFAAAVGGGFISRIGLGGMPFLLPLYYQVGLGYSPLHAALLIVPQPLAAMTCKLVITRILMRVSYRQALAGNAVLIGLVMASFATVTAATSTWVILAMAFIFGFLMSAQYTSLNTLAFADLSAAETSTGSSLASVGQQLSMSFGVAIASLLTALFLATWQGSAPGSAPAMSAAIRCAFVALGGLSVFSSVSFLALRHGDGAEVLEHASLQTKSAARAH